MIEYKGLSIRGLQKKMTLGAYASNATNRNG